MNLLRIANQPCGKSPGEFGKNEELNVFLTRKPPRVSIVTTLKIVKYSVGLMATQRIVTVQLSLLRNWFVPEWRIQSPMVCLGVT